MAETGRTYRARCVTCGAEWTGAEVDEREVPAGEARAFCICRDCGRVGRASIRLTARELAEYRRALRKTVSTMVQSFIRARARLQERCRALKQRIREGDEKEIETLGWVEERLARLASPDVDHLEKRSCEVERVEANAPLKTPPALCADCGGRTDAFRETPHGYSITCPRCGGKMLTRIR